MITQLELKTKDVLYLDHDTTVVKMVERIDSKSCPNLRPQLMAIAKNNSKILVLDMQSVCFIDSVGFGLLLSLLKAIRTQQGKLILSGIQANIVSLFEITETNNIFEVCDHFYT